jgi:hypothetical protein
LTVTLSPCQLVTWSLLPAAQPQRALPVDGQPFSAELAAIDATWRLTFLTAGRAAGVPGAPRPAMAAGDLVLWGGFPEPARRSLVVLVGGGLLVADVKTADKETLVAESELFGSIRLPLEIVAGAVLEVPPDPRHRDRLIDRLATATGQTDRILLVNEDELPGTIESIGDDVIHLKMAPRRAGERDRSGTAAAADGSSASAADGKAPHGGDRESPHGDSPTTAIELRRAAAIVFNPALARRPEASSGLRAWAGFQDGSRLIAAQLATEGTSLRVGISGGPVCTTELSRLAGLQPLGGRVAYLADLTPDRYRHVPYLALAWPYRTDRTVTGGWLRAGGRLYLKGIGVHSGSQLDYALRDPYRRFQAELAVDDETGGRGSVRFRVLLDGVPKYESPPVTGRARPRSISVDLSGAKRLELLVDYAGHADQMGRADWLNARLVR